MIPEERIKNCRMNYVRRLKKIIEIGGSRLEEFHLREIRREAKEEENNIEKDELDNGRDEKKSKDKADEESIKQEELKLTLLIMIKHYQFLKKRKLQN